MINWFHAARAVIEEDFSNPNTALTLSQVTSSTIYWPRPYKSSEWPAFETTKEYFVIWATEHSGSNGGIFWGEFDSFYGNTLHGFVQRGIIKEFDSDGTQIETPYLIKFPSAKSGITDEYFIYYHIQTQDFSVDGEPIQETKLITTSGGAALHECTWTDRGMPLGLYGDDDHTGYSRHFEREDGSLISHHLGFNTRGSIPFKAYISESSTGLDFQRLALIDVNLNGGTYRYSRIVPFVKNGVRYGFIDWTDASGNDFIAIAELDYNFLPVTFVKTILSFPDSRDLNGYIEGNTAYLLIKDGTVSNPYNDYQLFIYDLNDL